MIDNGSNAVLSTKRLMEERVDEIIHLIVKSVKVSNKIMPTSPSIQSFLKISALHGKGQCSLNEEFTSSV
jgi:hypothetical protein